MTQDNLIFGVLLYVLFGSQMAELGYLLTHAPERGTHFKSRHGLVRRILTMDK